MEFDRDLYQKAFSRIALSDKKREEILQMTEQNEKRRKPIGRRMLVAAVTALLAAILAMGANAATGGEMGDSFVKLVDSTTGQGGAETYMYLVDSGRQLDTTTATGSRVTIKLIDGPDGSKRLHATPVRVSSGTYYDTSSEAESPSKSVIKYTAMTTVEYIQSSTTVKKPTPVATFEFIPSSTTVKSVKLSCDVKDTQEMVGGTTAKIVKIDLNDEKYQPYWTTTTHQIKVEANK